MAGTTAVQPVTARGTVNASLVVRYRHHVPDGKKGTLKRCERIAFSMPPFIVARSSANPVLDAGHLAHTVTTRTTTSRWRSFGFVGIAITSGIDWRGYSERDSWRLNFC